MKPRRPKAGEPSWRYRRILIYATVVACFWFIYLLMDKPDTRVNDTIAWSLCAIVAVLVLVYTGFATAQDIAAIWTTRTARPYADPPLDPVPAPEQAPNVVVQGNAEIPIAPEANRR